MLSVTPQGHDLVEKHRVELCLTPYQSVGLTVNLHLYGRGPGVEPGQGLYKNPVLTVTLPLVVLVPSEGIEPPPASCKGAVLTVRRTGHMVALPRIELDHPAYETGLVPTPVETAMLLWSGATVSNRYRRGHNPICCQLH